MNTSPVLKPVKKSTRWLAKSKQGICSTLLCSTLLFTANAHAELNNLDDMHKQLDIMNSIIHSAVKNEPTNSRSRISSISSIYLHNQGVVFTLSTRHLSSFNKHMVMPTAPLPPISPEANFAFNLHDEMNDVVIEFESNEEDYEHAIDIFEQQRENSRELRSEQRDLAYELRDIARESKDAQYQLRHVEEKEKQALKAELKKLESKRVALEQGKAQLDKKAKKARVKRSERQALKAKQRVQYFDKLSSKVVDTLCMYGNGFKAVPKDEHVSIILKAAGKELGRRYQDRVFVFTKKDINACANDKIDSEKLLAKANKYQF